VTENARTAIVSFLLGVSIGAVAYYAYDKVSRDDDEERPPIIVKNGSIQFDTEVGWAPDGGNWKPDQPYGRHVKELIATISGADGSCPELRGVHLIVTYALSDISSRDFHIVLGGDEPMVQPAALLTHAANLLTYGTPKEGRISRIEALPSKQACTFSTDEGVITVNYRY
jgi:hypothetical protein